MSAQTFTVHFPQPEVQWNTLTLPQREELLRWAGQEPPFPPNLKTLPFRDLDPEVNKLLQGVVIGGYDLADKANQLRKYGGISPEFHAEPGNGSAPSPLSRRHATRTELEEIDAVLTDYLFFATGVDGILWDEDRYKDPNTPCHCLTYQKSTGGESNICFKKGIIGTLSQDQEAEFCKVMEPIYGSTAMKRRLSSFQQASEACSGMDLADRLNCMSKELKKSGTSSSTLGRTTKLPPVV
jgi:hypothetical protein